MDSLWGDVYLGNRRYCRNWKGVHQASVFLNQAQRRNLGGAHRGTPTEVTPEGWVPIDKIPRQRWSEISQALFSKPNVLNEGDYELKQWVILLIIHHNVQDGGKVRYSLLGYRHKDLDDERFRSRTSRRPECWRRGSRDSES